jgi:hypothetical protein
MSGQSEETFAGRARAQFAAALRSRAGNALLLANTLILLHVALAYGPFGHAHEAGCTAEWESQWEDGHCGGISIAWLVYLLASLPSYAVVRIGESLADPLWRGLCAVTAYRLDLALFLLVSGVQWLCCGHLLESAWAARRRGPRSLRVTPAPQPRTAMSSPPAVSPYRVGAGADRRPAQPASPPSRRRRSHARAVAQARSTVRVEVPSTSADSSTVSPAK